ncbi:AAA family ATPase [Sphingobacterium spiritivorum]
MKILSLKYTDEARVWTLVESKFERLTLLVGASGVGKTQILQSILKLKSISDGKSISGINWEIEFQTLNNDTYIWSGQFENLGDKHIYDFNDEDESKINPEIIEEQLIKNNNILVKRDKDNIYLRNEKTVKLSKNQSVLFLLREEDDIKTVTNSFRKIQMSDQTDSQSEQFRLNIAEIGLYLKKYKTIEEIQDANLATKTKLYLVYNSVPSVFQKIKDRFSDIFPQVEDVRIEPLEDAEGLPFYLKQHPFIQIKEKGIDKWIIQGNFSSGMFRSLIHISDIFLCNEGTVFLIDEFENSLGINCINELTNDILTSNRQIQFIITSHHPYIINNIDYRNWKLVTRTKGIVKTHKPEEYRIGKSKHDAFMQLIQLDQFQTGLE